jgi:hypothetical protein
MEQLEAQEATVPMDLKEELEPQEEIMEVQEAQEAM